MSEYYTSGRAIADKKAKAEQKKDLAGDYLIEQGYERQRKPRDINGGRDRLPENYTQKNKARLNDSLAYTPVQAKGISAKNTVVTGKKKSVGKHYRIAPKISVSEVVKAKPKTPFPIAAILCLLAITLMSLYVIHLYIELDELNASMVEYNNRISEMKNEERVLQTQKASKYNHDEIERIAKEKYGMVDADQLPKEYITPDVEDSIEIMETNIENDTPGALLSSFAGVVSNLLSYIN